LKHIMFKHVEDLALILEKCPVLEDLELHSITSDGIYCRKSSKKKLRKLNRADITMCCCYIKMKALSNLEYLRIQLSKVCLHY
jgi:predicted transposase YbfD/YdcC